MQFQFAVRSLGRYALGSVALAAVLLTPSAVFAQSAAPATSAQGKLSDAQVEANVLKAFAADSRLANQSINTSTVFGTVTLTGNVTDEDARVAAEQIAARTDGVKKVVDQLTVGGTATPNTDVTGSMPASQGASIAAANPQTQDSGNAPPQQDDQYADQQPMQSTSPYGAPQQEPYADMQPESPYGSPQQSYGNQQQGYGDPNMPPQAGNYPQGQRPRIYRRAYERQMAQGGYQQGAPLQGQAGGTVVHVPGGTDLPVRVNNWLSSGDAQPGSTFTAFVTNDILADGQIAIPRGATVEGTVLDAKGAGILKGRGELTLQLTALDLGGQRIPLQSLPFTINGHDKALRSVNSTILGAGLGALFGAAIGGGTGAAVGAGVGGAAGLGSAAATPSGNANLPAEAMVHFQLSAPLQVTTISEAEMQRLAMNAGPAAGQRMPPRPYGRPYPSVGVYAYPAPYYYRRYYGPRGYWW